MRHNKFIDTLILKPLSVIYGMATALRNKLFDWGILKEHKFNVPVVVIGNLAVGGTGKTPHTEYVVNSLMKNYRIAVLSRGYKRRTRGFIMASKRSTPDHIGAASYQIYQKYGHEIRVAVCEKRVKGIKELLRLDPSINLIVLDDAFQHRYVKPKVSIVLTEWNRPAYNDDILPLGRLRESIKGLSRAKIVVVTKCPSEIRPMDVRIIYDHLNLFPYQKLYFSHYRYGNLVSVFPDEVRYLPGLDWMSPEDNVIILTGIANPKPLIRYIKSKKVKTKVLRFSDHHKFTRRDFDTLHKEFNELNGRNKYIITTEKDAVRIATSPYFPHELKPHIFYLPIRVEFLSSKMPHGIPAFEDELKKLINSSSDIV